MRGLSPAAPVPRVKISEIGGTDHGYGLAPNEMVRNRAAGGSAWHG